MKRILYSTFTRVAEALASGNNQRISNLNTKERRIARAASTSKGPDGTELLEQADKATQGPAKTTSGSQTVDTTRQSGTSGGSSQDRRRRSLLGNAGGGQGSRRTLLGRA